MIKVIDIFELLLITVVKMDGENYYKATAVRQ